MPLGKLGRELTVEQGYAAARMTGLSILGSLQRTLGDLDRIAAWSRVFVPFNIPVEIEGEVELVADDPATSAPNR